jgi:hypothetical protein
MTHLGSTTTSELKDLVVRRVFMLDVLFLAQQTANVQVSLTLNGIIALLSGILILVIPKLLNYIVAIYLIIIGLVQIFNLRI